MIRYVSRTAVEADWRCRRSRYYMTEYHGTGIVSAKQADDLVFGSVIHKATEQIEREIMGWIPASMWAGQELLRLGFNDQMARLGQGLVAGYGAYLLPRLLKEYEILQVEYECSLSLTDELAIAVQPDLVVRRRSDGVIGYIEKKTTKWANENWITSWERSIQLQLGMRALQLEGLDAQFAVVLGFHKAPPHWKSKRLMSPLVWAYYDDEGKRYSAEWKRDWAVFDTSQYPGGMPDWVGWLERKALPDLASCFPMTAPISYRPSQVGAFLAQQAHRELEIQAWREAKVGRNLMATFPQNFSSCQIGGRKCAYYEACWQMTNPADPGTILDPNRNLISSGCYLERVPHHDLEAFSLDLDEEIG